MITGFNGYVLYLGKTEVIIGKSFRNELLKRLSNNSSEVF
jgi:hypothetical protein